MRSFFYVFVLKMSSETEAAPLYDIKYSILSISVHCSKAVFYVYGGVYQTISLDSDHD